MKATGIVRKLDNLGRVVLPIELRRTLNIKKNEPVEIFVDNENIVLKKYSPNLACKVTGEVSEDNLILAKGKVILSPEGVKQLLKELEVKL
ncbi:AbrB/MazE/SpoVT family DNA-binding domain-containing protein [Priestia megaterium]|uniref:AbrB/MazE/SpoVT family DNA-binding domain-containing protein n=1 Tax=Priestia megaterium TaxID=1404 RepID=UPI00070EB0FC|nr:AbrB/MazE/SpoVT family DNA-binding domain-containing protein [Priestia megaterium]KRF51306.1 transition state regulator Abh [Bacillus sp. Soil531]MCF6799903.1 AbrB/MazE/SpoVT family DNA-binding domain-containing protein [Bacillus sp. ET1]MBV6738331.1 AbrB/MazE/SpoVT family DNA-binding domain-containing protein [Priestia megaterium]MDP1442451.1 AbrB/MazE/SpoVT family DNA-binding domain-containing protein [Priestia megaterium]MDP1471469.1 AbrB/MazE/SpoVT family DNA-binding domain-containing p